LAYDETESSVNVLEFNLNVLNEQLMEKLKCKAHLLKSNSNSNDDGDDEKKSNNTGVAFKCVKYTLIVDTSELFTTTTTMSTTSRTNLDSNEIDLSCSIELKYTSQLGAERNLCHAFKKHFTMRFSQTAFATFDSIRDLR
jgi:hypothetical protein